MGIAERVREPGYRDPDFKRFAVVVVGGHPLARWLMPVGMGGLVLLGLSAVVLPRDVARSFFLVGRFVFILGYMVLVGLAFARRRRPAHVHVDREGLREGAAVVVPRPSIASVLVATVGTMTTIDVRGRAPIFLEIADPDAARELVAALDPDRDAAPLELLATTTPTYAVVLAWIGLPVLFSMPAQLLLLDGAGELALLGYGAPCVVAWLLASWWLMRRRRVTLTRSHLMYPRLLSRNDEMIPLGELVTARATDPFTIELTFTSRPARRFKIYDPAMLNEFLARVMQRAGGASVGGGA